MPHNTRKAPTASATLFKRGTTKTGNDGNKWTIVADTRGVQRWQLKKKPTTTMKLRRRHKSARVEADNDSVWGKNKPLEQFWRKLASGKKVVVIYAPHASSSHTIVNVPTSKTAMKAFFDECDADASIVAVLSSNMSQDAYEIFLYPKARDSTVGDVIRNYKKYFKSSGPMPADMIEKGFPEQKKVLYPA
jgi:hypothetical protein